jgi:hypothetical protein
MTALRWVSWILSTSAEAAPIAGRRVGEELTGNTIELISRDVEVLEVSQVVDRREARQAIARDMQGPNRGWDSAEVGDRVLVSTQIISIMPQLIGHDREVHIQLDLLQLRQELLQSRHAIDPFPSEVDRSQFFPVGLEGLYVRDEFDESVVGHPKAALGQECRVGRVARRRRPNDRAGMVSLSSSSCTTSG